MHTRVQTRAKLATIPALCFQFWVLDHLAVFYHTKLTTFVHSTLPPRTGLIHRQCCIRGLVRAMLVAWREATHLELVSLVRSNLKNFHRPYIFIYRNTQFLFIFFLHCLLALLCFLPSFSLPFPARHTASPTVGNVNGLSLLGVAAPSLALQANLRQPLRREQHTRSLQQSAGAKNRTMWKDDDGFRLGLGGLYRPLHAEHSRAGSWLLGQGRAFLTVLCFESTRTWHMPQIVCSHHAADPRSAVIGDRTLLSTAECGMCVSLQVCASAISNCVSPRVCSAHLWFLRAWRGA